MDEYGKYTPREKVEVQYQYIGGIIISPGKFEGEKLYAPYFYDMVMKGFSDWNTALDWKSSVDIIYIHPEDRHFFPELDPNSYAVTVEESETGFVYVREKTEEETVKIISECTGMG